MYMFGNKLIFFTLFISCTNVLAQRTTSDEDEIRLFYYPNAQNAAERIELDLNNSSSFSSIVDKNKKAKILVHGANNHCTSEFPLSSIKAYLQVQLRESVKEYNVFCLDYEQLAKVPYPGIPGNDNPTLTQRFEYVIDIVGSKAARYLVALYEHNVISTPSQVHLIGGSLGGQVVGVTGRKIQEILNFQGKLGRITGLDVMNSFMVYQNEVRLSNQLDSSDADFVDIIHTNDGQIGLKGDYGRVDYYPDGGQHQKACLQNGPIWEWIERATGTCSHVIVGKYWANSILNPTIQSCKASSYEDYQRKQKNSECTGANNITFGEYVSQSAYGKFYMDYPLQ